MVGYSKTARLPDLNRYMLILQLFEARLQVPDRPDGVDLHSFRWYIPSPAAWLDERSLNFEDPSKSFYPS